MSKFGNCTHTHITCFESTAGYTETVAKPNFTSIIQMAVFVGNDIETILMEEVEVLVISDVCT